MSDAAMIISTSNISNVELKSFAVSLGGLPVPQEKSNFVISDGDGSVWLGVQPPELMSALYDDEILNDWNQALGGKPVSIIELQIGHSDKSYQLYLYIALKLGERWNLILDDIDENILLYPQLVKKYRDNNDILSIDKNK